MKHSKDTQILNPLCLMQFAYFSNKYYAFSETTNTTILLVVLYISYNTTRIIYF